MTTIRIAGVVRRRARGLLTALTLTAVGCTSASSPSRWVQIGGTYRATVSGTGIATPQISTLSVQQDAAAVTAHITGFGDLACTAAAAGTEPRLTACSATLDACTAQRTFSVVPVDDGASLTFAVTTRQTDCTGQSGGTLLFQVVLTPQ